MEILNESVVAFSVTKLYTVGNVELIIVDTLKTILLSN